LLQNFLKDEGWSDEDVMRVDSDRKGDISENEWLGKSKNF
jgi:hypothetical protein